MSFNLVSPIFEFPILSATATVFLGLVLGSFASAITYRVPLGLSWIKGSNTNKSNHNARSACPKCKTNLGLLDLIPIFSWLFSRAKCRHCKSKISAVYPICELLTLLGCIGIFTIYGLTPLSLLALATMPFLVALLMIDIKYMILPNHLVAIVFMLGLAHVLLSGVFNSNWSALLSNNIGGAVLYAGFAWGMGITMTKLLKKEALGFGDVKLFAAIGIWCGALSLGYFSMLAGVFGVCLALIWQKIKKTAVFPFGPSLIFAFYVLYLLQGAKIL